MTSYRVAIVGTGDFAPAHVNALNAAGDRVDLVAAVDINETAVRSFCDTHHIPQWFTDTEQMLAAVHPDLVHIVSPPGTHKALAIASLRAGAWVYCEKPLCASLAEFDEIAQAEAETGRFVSTVFQWRFGSAGKHVKRLIDVGAMGRPLVGLCQTLWYRGPEYYRIPWRQHWAGSAGGVAATMGVHLTDLFLWLMGDWREVEAIAATLNSPAEVEDVAMALVQFENGALGSISSSSISPRQESYLRLDFEKATVDVYGVYGYSNANWRFAIADKATHVAELERWRNIEEEVASSHKIQVAELLDSMDRNERPFVSGPEARRILEFLASMYKSGFTRQIVERGSIGPDDPFYRAMNGWSAPAKIK